MAETQDRDIFKELKRLCVPLLENSRLSPVLIPRVLSLLTELHALLQNLHHTGFNFSPSLISYIMFPFTSILGRNDSAAIPDRVLEMILLSLRILFEDWWRYCDLQTWEQLFKLCGAFIGDIGVKGKGKERDDELKEAAIRCLISLTRKRESESDADLTFPQPVYSQETARLSKFLEHARTVSFIPILGQTVNALITTAASSSLRLQRASLELLCILFELYVSEDFAPTVLPGFVSTMSRIALGTPTSKSWANGEIVSLALSAMQTAIIKSVSDDICIKEGLVHEVTDLDDLITVAEGTAEREASPGEEHHIRRTLPWLKATSSQLLMALKTLTPILSHPTATALLAMSSLSSSLLESTSLTLPFCQPLLSSFLLSLSRSTYDSVSSRAHSSLIQLTSPPSKTQHALLQTLLEMTGNILSTLPRVLPSHDDSRVEHLAGQVEAICRLVASQSENFSILARGLGKLFGPTGGIERWGWRLLAVMEFEMSQVTVMDTPAASLMLEQGTNPHEPTFPELLLKHVATRSVRATLEQMFRGLGRSGGEDCIYAVEWFTAIGRNRRDDRGVAALWLGCRLLEGIAGVFVGISEVHLVSRRSNRFYTATRGLSRRISELWEDAESELETFGTSKEDGMDDMPSIEHRQGIVVLDQSLRIGRGTPVAPPRKTSKSNFHRMVALQLLSVSARILQARFTPMLLYTMYPVLQSIISPVSQLSDSGFAALSIIASSLSYASPANLLLSNFDYVLDAVSRRLSRQRLDMDAVKVLLVVVRLVGRDVIQKASDVVEECFDRLDEYHGYEIVVDGLIEVLLEVVKVVESDEDSHVVREEDTVGKIAVPPDNTRMDAFESWFASRNDTKDHEDDSTDYGPAPRRPWGGRDTTVPEESKLDEGQTQTEPEVIKVTPIQALSKQIVSRTIYFLTHQSATIRAKILSLLSSAVPILPESALLTSIHQAWPFILNRLSDREPFVVTAAAGLVEALSMHVGPFMYRKVWDDVWPCFRTLLQKLEVADSKSALIRRGAGYVGTESAYTQSHKLYRSMLKTMTASMKGVQVNDSVAWEMFLCFRRFLHNQSRRELQICAIDLFVAAGKNNADAMWLVLFSTMATGDNPTSFLQKNEWDIKENSETIFQQL
ncbi:ARM repeat-containing protein [Russula earlei]|uniref:ARM repeat-containing protein n=1 Tax=Russula earlei TaxID=71964 RepID=A0ACC0ULR6_9AGAM|nr:ARM repeat-containing protein [Russula earlei]